MEPVLVSLCRTPQGKKNGIFADIRSEQLSIPVVNALLNDTGLSGEQVDDLQWGCVKQEGEQGNNIARTITLLSDLGESVPAATIDRQCASSAHAIMSAADAIRAGQRQCIIAGGVESMTRVERAEDRSQIPGLDNAYDLDELAMGQTAETVAEQYGVSRETQDEYAATSQKRAVDATREGRFDDEIVPIDNGEEIITEDEGLRPGTTAEKLASLPPVFEENGTVTAGNSSQMSDGAAAVMVTSQSFADDYSLDILAHVGQHSVVGVDPHVMGIGPVPAVREILDRTDRSMSDYGLVELNEAFASQTVYCKRQLGIDDDSFNVNGGAIAIGHPLGASGARLPVTLVHEMQRRGTDRGIATACVGFGQGVAIEFTHP
ncbi:thiolase family protein [Halosolutus amylolyticus]|uniref:acetyl-CoA C-acyltransferase n=1 Tax=Halosolutus amylolyticus TaxID=2932267 RepID=A0ABD5PIJ0_9EURY|nr:thiolase family protein [Halosolutus amylolyticus]